MKKQLPAVFIFICALISNAANGQCDFTPDIYPIKVILCPDGTDTLVTSKAYDSYQWYKNNEPIPGGTKRYYVVHQYEDAGSYFKVEATLNGCTAFSKRVLVDGYAFLPPYIIETGDVGTYDPIRDVLVECSKDTLILTLGSPYVENIQWYNNYKPIKNATNQSYVVTTKGSHTVCGSPKVCPGYSACELIPLNVIFDHHLATITEKNDTLFASGAKEFAWFFNGKLIPGVKKNYLVPRRNGCYQVATTNKYSCTAISESYFYKGSKHKESTITVAPNPVDDMLHISIKTDGVSWIRITDLFGNRVLQMPFTSYEQNVVMANMHTGTYLIQLLNKQTQVIGSTKIFKE